MSSSDCYLCGKIRVGVIGCGGRGMGAANDCLNADEGIKTYAMGGFFRNRLERSCNLLKKGKGKRPTYPTTAALPALTTTRRLWKA